MARMISSESKTIIGDREVFAELYPKTLARSTRHILTQQRYTRTIGEDDSKTHALMMLARIVAAT